MQDSVTPEGRSYDSAGLSRPTYPNILQIEQTATGCRLHLYVPEDLAYFEGHFPHISIVAGVCQLKWVIDYIALYGGETRPLAAMDSVKFLRPLFPRQIFVMEFVYDPDAAAWQYDVFAGNKSFSSGRLNVQV